jgi:cytochrome o ubiquinol oxidase operon protein cyoD
MDHAHASSAGESHGSEAAYLRGFILSVILTAAAFAFALSGILSVTGSMMMIAALAVVQIFVHLFYFLHMNASSEQRWNVMAFAFTVVIVAIVVGGTLWVMYNANMNMMPSMN